jgi:hypothetical protein
MATTTRTTGAILIVVFWIVAATLVGAAHVELERFSALSAILSIAAITGAAFAYTHCCARAAGMSHALGVGIAWLVLSIAAEITITAIHGHAFYSLLGSPQHALLRNVHLFVWIFSPALFAHHTQTEGTLS